MKTKRTKLGFLEALRNLKRNEFLQIPCSNGACIKIESHRINSFDLMYHCPANTVLPQQTKQTDLITLEHLVISSMLHQRA